MVMVMIDPSLLGGSPCGDGFCERLGGVGRHALTPEAAGHEHPLHDTEHELGDDREHGDGERACDELTADTLTEFESQEGKPCAEAILDAGLTPGEVVRSDVAETSAAVDLVGGTRLFLDHTPEGWRIGAAGCRPRPGGPYDCEVQS